MDTSKMVTIFAAGVICKQVTMESAMDYVFDDEINTEEHPLHIYDENGQEIEW